MENKVGFPLQHWQWLHFLIHWKHRGEPASGPVVCWDVWDHCSNHCSCHDFLSGLFLHNDMDRKCSVISSILKTVKPPLTLLSTLNNLLFLFFSKLNSSRFVYSDCPYFTLYLFRPLSVQLFSPLPHWNCSWGGHSGHVLFLLSLLWYDLDFLGCELNAG